MSFVLDHIESLVTLRGAVAKKGRNIGSEDLSIIHNACMVVEEKSRKSKILWQGPRSELPGAFKKLKKVNVKDHMVLPGFVDSHTHLVFGGNRAREFEMRLAGATYQQIAQTGGGIAKTVNATRALPEKEILKISQDRAQAFIKQGVTTFEIKSGYGLNLETEKKILNVANKIKKSSPATVLTTYMAAHAVPPEYKGQKSQYVKELTEKWLPKVKTLVDFVDIFFDEGYFDKNDADALLASAQKFNIPVKVHADELALTGGTAWAVKNQALSADHLLRITDTEIGLLADSETTATLLPTTAFFLKDSYAPARKLLDRGARVALATDFNPGTSPTQDISLVGILAALGMGMRAEEILTSLTLNGAYALGLAHSKGALIEGYDADFTVLEASSVAQLVYEFGYGKTLPANVFCSGKWVKLDPK